MTVEYDSKLAKYFTNQHLELRKAVGIDLAKAIKKRIDMLEAISSFQHFMSNRLGNPHPLSGEFKGCYAISLSPNYRLIIEPQITDKCDVIIVRGVVDYHGEKTNWILP